VREVQTFASAVDVDFSVTGGGSGSSRLTAEIAVSALRRIRSHVESLSAQCNVMQSDNVRA
jgi:hypothetical protein